MKPQTIGYAIINFSCKQHSTCEFSMVVCIPTLSHLHADSIWSVAWLNVHALPNFEIFINGN